MLLELRSRGFYDQAYADDPAVLVTGDNMIWIRGRSVARGGGAGGYSLPIGMSTKMQIEKNTTFLALLRLFYAPERTK